MAPVRRGETQLKTSPALVDDGRSSEEDGEGRGGAKYNTTTTIYRDLRRFEIRFVLMVRFEIFESSALSIVIHKETIGGG